jgi:hypothetical protein
MLVASGKCQWSGAAILRGNQNGSSDAGFMQARLLVRHAERAGQDGSLGGVFFGRLRSG